MKPSERLNELFRATEKEVSERLTRTQELRFEDIFRLVTEPLQRWLDEQNERGARGAHVRLALAIIDRNDCGPAICDDGHRASINAQLELAGLTTRIENGSHEDHAFRDITEEAIREGLF